MFKKLEEKIGTQCLVSNYAQLVECGPMHLRVAGSIPGQGTHPACGKHKRQPTNVSHNDVSLSLSPSL